MLLTIHDSKLKKVAFIDNNKQGTLNYFNDTWTRYLDSGSSTFEFTVFKKSIETDSQTEKAYHVLNDKSFVSFRYKKVDYLFNVMQIEEDEETITCVCENLNLELLLEYAGPYAADKAMTFKEYLEVWDMLKNSAMVIGTNEVSDKKLTLEWTGSDTNLKRLLSIANYFEAEVEFRTVLNPDSTLRHLQLNIYHANDGEKYQGVGTKRDTIIKYGRNIKSITRRMDKTGIWNAVRPSGKKEVTKKVAKETEKTTNANATVSTPVTQAKKYDKGDLGYAGHKLSANRINKILDLSRQFKLLPSGVICQLYLESWWGDSPVAKADNNWSGMTGGAQTRPSGIKVTTGSARPANEGSTYMHYASVDDFFYDYMYLLGPNGNGYKTSGATSFDAYVKGLFTVGGARYNYAASGYNKYITLMNSIRSGVNKANSNMLDHIDSIYKNPGTTTTTTTVPKTTNSKLEAMVKWYEGKKGKVTYSMAARNGPNSYDCSSSGYYAMKSAGFTDTLNYAFSTETCHSMLTANNFQLIKEGTNVKWTMQRGDIIIWGKKGYSAGHGGHYMVAYSATDIIHCNGAGITINNYASYSSGRSVYVYVYRLKDAKVSTTSQVKQETVVTNVATKVKAALAWLEKNKGVRLGNGQCYGLVSGYVHQIGGPGLGAGYAFSDLITGGWGAAYIGTDYNWAKHGWKVKTSGIAVSDLQAGVVVNIKPNNAWAGTGSAGHTAVVKSVSGSNIVIIEQNYAGRQYCLQNTYNINQYLSCLQSICIPPELVAGATVKGKTTTAAGKATTESYTTTEIVYEEVTETVTLYIDEKKYKEWKNESGVVEYYLKNGCLYAPLSRQDYPSVLSGTETNDNWIRKDMTVETDSEDVLISTALRELKKNAYPTVEYEVDGYMDVDIGDTVRIDDDGFAPKLLLQARVSEQHISFSNPNNNKTVFSNFKALENKTSTDLISRMNQMFEESKPYQIRLETDNGVAFKNHEGQTTLTPTLLRGGKEYECQWDYSVDGVVVGSGSNITITAEMVPQTTVLTVSAIINGNVVATEQLSFINADDGDNFDINSPEVQEFREQINETLDVRANQALEDAKDYANAKSVEARDALDKMARTIDEKQEALEAEIRAMLEQADKDFESEKLENLKRESEIADSLSSEFTSEYESISLEVANNKSEAESLANRLNNSLTSEMSSELLEVANSLKADDDRLKSNYSSLSTNLKNLSTSASNLSKSTSILQSQITSEKARLNSTASELSKSTSALQSQVTSEKTRLNSTASELVKQANSQSLLTNRVTTLTSNYDSTKTVTSELSKSLTSMNGSLTAVTNRTKTVEDGLSGLRTSYNQTTATVSALTGKVDTTTERVATIETGLNGVNERFEKLRVGTRNLLRNTANLPVGNKIIDNKPSGNWALDSYGNGTGSVKSFGFVTHTVSTNRFSAAPQAGITHYARVENNTSGNKDWAQTIDSIKLNTDYTLSFWVRRQGTGTVNMLVRCWNDAEDFKLNKAVTNTDWVRQSVTFKFKKKYNNSIQFGMSASDATGAIDFCGMQLEEGNILSDWHPNEEDFSQAIAEYKRDAEQNLASLSSTVKANNDSFTAHTNVYNQNAKLTEQKLTELNAYTTSEGVRASEYFEKAKSETARQLNEYQNVIRDGYVAKATYTSEVSGINRLLSETKTTVNTVETTANTAKSTADNAKTIANSATSIANNAETVANSAKTAANNAKTTAENAQKVANNVDSKVTTIESNLADYKQTTTESISALQKTTQTQTGDIAVLKNSVSKVEQTADGLRTTIENVEAKIPTSIGGTNMLLDTDQPSLAKRYAKYDRYFSDYHDASGIERTIEASTDVPSPNIKYRLKTVVKKIVNNKETSICWYANGGSIELIPGEQYTISVWAKASVDGMRIRHQVGSGKYVRDFSTVTTSWKRYSWTFTFDSSKMSDNENKTRIYIGGAVLDKVGTVWTCGFKLEHGSVATDYAPNPAEVIDEVSNVKNEITQNTMLINQTASSIRTELTQVESKIPIEISYRNLALNTFVNWNSFVDITSNNNWVINIGSVPLKDKTNIYKGSKLNLFVYVSADDIVLDESITNPEIQIMSLTSDGVWRNENTFHNKWRKPLKAGNNYYAIKITDTVQDVVVANSNSLTLKVRIDGVKTGKIHWRALMVTSGDVFPSNWSPAPEDTTDMVNVVKTQWEQRADKIEGSVATLNGTTVKTSQLTINSDGIVMKAGTSDTNFTNAIASKLSLNQNAVDIIAPKIKVSGNMIVDGSIQTKHITTNAIQTQHIQSSAISSDKIATEAITADKIKSKAITGAKIEAGTIESAHIKTGSIEGSRIKAGTITGNLLAANTVVADNIAAGAITSGKIAAVGLSADVIKGGTIVAKNGETTIGLNDGIVSFLSNYTGVRRVEANAATMGLRFNNHNVTVNGSNRILSRIWLGGERREGTFTDNWGNGGFSGIVTETIKDTLSKDDDRSDRVSIVSDRIRLVHSFNDDPDTLPVHGWQFETYRNASTNSGRVVLRPYGEELKNWSLSTIYSGDISLCSSSGAKGSLREIIVALYGGLQDIVNGGTTAGAKSSLTNRINYIKERL